MQKLPFRQEPLRLRVSTSANVATDENGVPVVATASATAASNAVAPSAGQKRKA
jgi:hypothetical protein